MSIVPTSAARSPRHMNRVVPFHHQHEDSMQLPGGRASWMKFWLTCLLAWFTGACTDLPQLERGS